MFFKIFRQSGIAILRLADCLNFGEVFGSMFNDFWIDFGEVLERFLDRFRKGFWKDFGKVLDGFLEIILIPFSYCSAYHVGMDLGRDFDIILIVFEMILNSFLHDFGGHVDMILLLL